MRQRLLWLVIAACALGVLAGLGGCSKSEEDAVKAGFDPGPPIRKAFAASLQVYASQISQRESVSGHVPEGDGVSVLEQAGIRGVPNTDPWGNEVRYHGEGDRFTLSSAGPDRQWGTKDDIVISK